MGDHLGDSDASSEGSATESATVVDQGAHYAILHGETETDGGRKDNVVFIDFLGVGAT